MIWHNRKETILPTKVSTSVCRQEVWVYTFSRKSKQ